MDFRASQFYRLKISLFGLILMTGCSHMGRSDRSSPDSSNPPLPKTLTEVLQQDINHPVPGTSPKSMVVENGEIIVQGIKLKNTHFDFPVSVNSRVEYWIDYFCGR